MQQAGAAARVADPGWLARHAATLRFVLPAYALLALTVIATAGIYGSAFSPASYLVTLLTFAAFLAILPPAELFRMGFAMIAYPTTLIFRVARTIENALADLKRGVVSGGNDSVDFETFKDITGFADWARIEQHATPGGAS